MSTAAKEVYQYLHSKGFSLTAPPSGVAQRFEGPIPFKGGSVQIRLDVVDWDFKARPEIYLVQRPQGLDGYRPHLGLSRNLCYLDRESVQLDRYQPVNVIARCLLIAAETLEDIAADRQRLDIQGEFLANWLAPVEFPILLWETSPLPTRLLSVHLCDFPHKSGVYVITDDLAKSRFTLEGIGAVSKSSIHECVCEFLTSKAPAFDPDHWPLDRVQDVLDWLQVWDIDLRKKLLNKLESLWTRGHEILVALFSTPAGQFGFTFNISYLTLTDQRHFDKHGSDRRQKILKTNPVIERFISRNLSPKFIHGRNQENRDTLIGKKIAVIGCGAVGGYLATFLARLGAGFGAGELKLFDTQTLQSENLGRHVLSMRDLYRNKADGVTDHIRREFPYLNLVPRRIDATEALDLFDSDLVIDASGLSSISSVVNAKNIDLLKGGRASAVLHIWVEGQGEAARGLLVDSLKHMCFDCQFLREPGKQIRDRFPLTQTDRHTAREYPGDCSSYMPFAVSACTAAAGLALDMTRAWARQESDPRLRSRRLNMGTTQARNDSSPSPLDKCPACRK